MKRMHLLGIALLITVVVSWWAGGLDDTPGGPSGQRGEGRRLPAPAVIDRIDLGGLDVPSATGLSGESPDSVRAATNLFPVVSFEPPLRPPPVQRPMAPPLPFHYSGMLEDGGSTMVFLAEGAQMRSVRAGEVLDGRYRVSAISPGRIDFIYLPLNETQSLATGNLP